MTDQIEFILLDPNLPWQSAPQTSGSAGLDLIANIEDAIALMPGERQLIPCGIAIAMPKHLEAQVRPRSGLALKHGVTVLNSPGTIDSDYRGEIGVILINHGQQAFTIKRHMRIAQIVISKITTCNWTQAQSLPKSERDTQGFGHTG